MLIKASCLILPKEVKIPHGRGFQPNNKFALYGREFTAICKNVFHAFFFHPVSVAVELQHHLYLSSEPGLTKQCAHLPPARGIASPGCTLLMKVTLSLSFPTRVLCVKMSPLSEFAPKEALFVSVSYHTLCAVRKPP